MSCPVGLPQPRRTTTSGPRDMDWTVAAPTALVPRSRAAAPDVKEVRERS